jgi:hypothetical protein
LPQLAQGALVEKIGSAEKMKNKLFFHQLPAQEFLSLLNDLHELAMGNAYLGEYAADFFTTSK